ncbi:MAG: tRNA threonylcarbamoyladenosine dehydratase [Prevotellaceae bacterium]|nr:tRNA threonylcarbamoyladenosine dehydratase [Prevotellaceae bacterium]
MQSELERSKVLFGDDGLNRLRSSKVIIFGVGGVGGYALEVIARSGVGAITIVDADKIEPSNINRQLLALHSTIGQTKVSVAKERVHDINPDCNVEAIPMFYLPENSGEIDLFSYDYVVDCIDTVAAKVELIRRCNELGIPIISSMGAGNKMDATTFRVADIYETSVDPLAKAVRKKCKELGIKHLKVVYSTEQPTSHDGNFISSNAFVPAAMGVIIGSEVVKDIIRGK